MYLINLFVVVFYPFFFCQSSLLSLSLGLVRGGYHLFAAIL